MATASQHVAYRVRRPRGVRDMFCFNQGRSDELNWRSTSSRPVRTFSAPVPKPNLGLHSLEDFDGIGFFRCGMPQLCMRKTVAKPPPSPLSIIGKDLTEMQKVERQADGWHDKFCRVAFVWCP